MSDEVDLPKIEDVLKKLNLSEDEAMTLFSHFTKRYINEKGCLSLNVSGSTEWEGDSKYGTISIDIKLELDDETILETSEYCSIGLG